MSKKSATTPAAASTKSTPGSFTKAENRQQLYIRSIDLPVWRKFKRQCARAGKPLNQVLMTWARRSVGAASEKEVA